MLFVDPRYPTYSVFIAIGIACLLVFICMPLFIRAMRREGVGQQIRADGPQRHLVKQGTPTMGGVIILLAVVITCLLMAPKTMRLTLALGATLLTAALGLLDDIESVAHKRSLGLTPSQKMVGLIAISVTFCLLAVNICGISPNVALPGGAAINLGVLTTTLTLGTTSIQIPWLYLAFVFLLMAGMSNATNLTDGLDGLAAGSVLVVMLALAAVAFWANQLELAIFAASIAGGCIGFLWFNCYPATIFMGDTGSLALGAAISALAILTKTEVTTLIMSGLFISETLSVMIQVISFKKTGKRVFLMAPLHHHFEKLGWSETKVVIRFWIVSAAFATIGFALMFQLW